MPILDWQGQLRKTNPAMVPPGGVFIARNLTALGTEETLDEH